MPIGLIVRSPQTEEDEYVMCGKQSIDGDSFELDLTKQIGSVWTAFIWIRIQWLSSEHMRERFF